jgi:PEP-CTERM motif
MVISRQAYVTSDHYASISNWPRIDHFSKGAKLKRCIQSHRGRKEMTLTKHIAHATALGVAMLIGCGLCVPRAQAAYTLTLQPSMIGVTATGIGSINFDALDLYGDELGSSLLEASGGAIIVGPTTDTDDTFYSGITGPADFGPGDEFLADMGDGAIVGLGTFDQTSGGVVAVPQGYVSGASLGTSTATWSGATITGLGLTPGSYVWTWGDGPTTDSFTLDIIDNGIPGAPEPATWAMMLLGFVGLAFLRTRRRIPASG